MTQPIRILHVDDDPDLLGLAAQFLERADGSFRVETESDPTAVADRLETGEPVDCLVVDYDMPGLDGLELLERVRASYPSLPFILFTGKGSETIASEAISLGVTDYMQKEVGTDQYEVLANRVRNAVERHRAQRELHHQEAVFETLARQDIVGIFIIVDGELTYVNPTFADIFGYEPDEVVGTEPHTYAAPADREEVRKKIEDRLEGAAESHHYRFTGQRKDGSTIRIEVHGARTVLDGQPATVGVLMKRD